MNDPGLAERVAKLEVVVPQLKEENERMRTSIKALRTKLDAMIYLLVVTLTTIIIDIFLRNIRS